MKKEDSIKVRSVKDCFRKNLTPNKGRIITKRRKPSEHEMKTAKLLLRKFGGTITFLKEKRKEGLKMPDAIWSGIKVEIKEASGKSSVNNRLRKGLEQVGNKGIVVLDISKNQKSIKEIRNEAIHRVKRSKSKDTNTSFDFKIIFFRNGKLLDVLEITKKREA